MTIALANTGLVAGTWNIDPTHSTVGFAVRHLVVSKVRGTFDDFTGQITIAEDGTPSVVADIKVDSVNTRNEGRDGHLKNADFFEAEKFPVATFRSTSVKAKGSDYVLTGDFTLHGVTKEIDLDLDFLGANPGMGHGPVAGFEASTVINRRDFDISIDMPLEGGGAVVGDKITLTIEIEAGLQA
ncbi:YceI family protein [Tomitella biformata]|uniref:YceI family protein n=1 Tax=Tomitella biformata TaxID=630403 RepID=UPI00046641DD|nr:YceI family protein [Tomitella biformata]